MSVGKPQGACEGWFSPPSKTQGTQFRSPGLAAIYLLSHLVGPLLCVWVNMHVCMNVCTPVYVDYVEDGHHVRHLLLIATWAVSSAAPTCLQTIHASIINTQATTHTTKTDSSQTVQQALNPPAFILLKNNY